VDDLKDIVNESKKNPQAFAKIYELFFDKIYGYVYYKIGIVAEAEDISEQVFLKALEGIGNFEWKGVPFSSWLFRIASNLVVDYFRKKNKLSTVPIEEQAYKIADNRRDTEDMINLKLSFETAQKAICKLSEDQQNVVILKFLNGFSNAEIAGVLGKTEGAVKSIQHRALNSLRKALKGELLNE